MDLITQGILGATLAQSISKPGETRNATFVGFMAGLAADADILIRSSSDPLLTIEFHRHFTHSLLFIPVGALIVSLVLWFFFRDRLAFKRLYVFAILGYSMSGILDACTSYGTYLFWPFNNEAVALRIISIIDPIFTFILLVATGLALRRDYAKPARIGLVLSGIYLMLGFIQLHRAESLLETLAISRGHSPQRLIAKPSFGNIILWRGIYQHGDLFYVDAIRAGFRPKIYEGSSIKVTRPEIVYDIATKDTLLYKDILRFNKFSQSYTVVHPQYQRVLGDVRYAMLPDSVHPLWGIEFDPEKPDMHANYRVFRELTVKQRGRFFDMLVGR